MTALPRVAVALVASLMWSACGGERPAADHAGISEDVNRVAVVFAESPRFSLGGIDVVGPTQFSGIISIEVSGDGSVWVIDGPTQELRVFSSEGAHRFSLGGQGDGPGEFRGLNFVGSESDGTIVAVDPTLRRVTTYSASGRLTGTVRWNTTRLLRPIGVTTRNELVAITEPGFPASRTGGVYSDTIRVLAWDEPDGVADTIARVPGFKWLVTPTSGSILPFTRTQAFAVGAEIYASFGPEVEIHVLGADGLERRLSVDRAPTPVASIRSDYLAELRDKRSAEQVKAAEERLEHPEVPEYIGAYSELVVASTGHLWAERNTYDPDLRGVWDVFDPDGRLLGQARPPSGFSIYSIDGNLVTGVASDDFGVPYLQQWEITWL